MQTQNLLSSRRHFLTRVGIGAAAVGASHLFEPGVFAEQLERRMKTPRLTQGPFYPDHLPLDTDNDLLIVNDSITPAVGDVTHLSGRILDAHGDPVRNAVIEIWQVDNHGSYIHTEGMNPQAKKRDKNFQGFGRFLTSSTGEYYFRTIKPTPYPGRAPHIHVKVNVKGKEQITTQIFVQGQPQNQNDGIFNDIADAHARQSVTADFVPLKDSKIGELAATFDIVLGYTPEA